jgi:hypothetical protein
MRDQNRESAEREFEALLRQAAEYLKIRGRVRLLTVTTLTRKKRASAA